MDGAKVVINTEIAIATVPPPRILKVWGPVGPKIGIYFSHFYLKG